MKTKLTLLSVFIVAIALSLTLAASAAIPHIMNYQGKATDKAGAPLNGAYNLTFRIYNTETGGSPKWTETQFAVSISNGIFQVQLGSVTPLNLPFDETYWISIAIKPDGEMIPRTKLASVGYAVMAETAGFASTAGVATKVDTTDPINAKGGLIIESRASDPQNPVTGQIWIRTDK